MRPRLITGAGPHGTILRRDGPYVQTEIGRFLDLAGGQHALLFSRVGEAAFPKLLSLDDTALFGGGRHVESPAAHALADWIADYARDPEMRSYLVSGGTEGIEIAIALALEVQRSARRPQRQRIAGFSHSYHGFSVAALAAGSHPGYRRQPDSTLRWPTVDRAVLTSPAATSAALRELFASDTIAALVVEPIGGTTSGAMVIDGAVHESLLAVCREHEVVLISDEVITGFGRTGSRFSWMDDTFDIRVSGKLLGGGVVPICAVSTSRSFGRSLDTAGGVVPVRATYAGNAITARLALQLQLHRQPDDHVRIAELGSTLRSFLEERLTPLGIAVRGRGFLQAAVKPTRTPREELAHILVRARASGVIAMGGIGSDLSSLHIMVTPALDATVEDLCGMAEGVRQLFDEGRTR